MISLKIGAFIAIAAFAAGSLFAPPVQQAIAAVIATDVQCTGCVGTSDVAGNAITAAKIKDGEVKAAEIATDSVGSSEIMPNSVGAVELQGVSKLIFGQCIPSDTIKNTSYSPGDGPLVTCKITGVDSDDSASATMNWSDNCFAIRTAYPGADKVDVVADNRCATSAKMTATATIAVIVYDE